MWNCHGRYSGHCQECFNRVNQMLLDIVTANILHRSTVDINEEPQSISAVRQLTHLLLLEISQQLPKQPDFKRLIILFISTFKRSITSRAYVGNSYHVLRQLFPPILTRRPGLRKRAHPFTLPLKDEKQCIPRVLYRALLPPVQS